MVGAYYYVEPALPAAETIRDIPLQIPLRIFSRDGHLISEIGERRRVLVTYDESSAARRKRFCCRRGSALLGAPGHRLSRHSQSTFSARIYRQHRERRQHPDATTGAQLLPCLLIRLVERKFKEASLAFILRVSSARNRSWRCSLIRCFSVSVPMALLPRRRSISTSRSQTSASPRRQRWPAYCRHRPVTTRSAASANAEMRRGYVLGRMADIGLYRPATILGRNGTAH